MKIEIGEIVDKLDYDVTERLESAVLVLTDLMRAPLPPAQDERGTHNYHLRTRIVCEALDAALDAVKAITADMAGEERP